MVRIIGPYSSENQVWTQIKNADTYIRMKRTFRHVLARLRERLGNMTQKELAAHGGTSVWTIQAIELGKLKLSQGLAFKISEATGVDYGWLLENDLSREPVNQDQKPYSEADLIRAQEKGIKQERLKHTNGKMDLTQAYFLLRLVWEDVVKKPDELSFFLFRLKQFVDSELRKIPALQEAHIPRGAQIDIGTTPSGQFEILKVSTYPTLFPVSRRSFDLMESDASECRKAFEEHQTHLKQKADQQNNQQAIDDPLEIATKRSMTRSKPKRTSK
jgi:transcriptional regulator with XRE-family HTH domain